MTYFKRLTTSVAVAMVAVAAVPAMASDHLDAPALRDSGMGQLDVNDLYAFQSPVNPDNSVLILTVNPAANDRGQGLSPTDFGTAADGISYQIQIDNTGDSSPNITYEATFAGSGSAQTVSLTRNGLPEAAGATGAALTLNTDSQGQLSTGVFDDPFFFDLNGFNNGFAFTGDDFFAGLDVSAIVLEVPSSELTANPSNPNIGVSARTLLDGEQVDRVGRPAINTALIPSDRKDEFNVSNQLNDFASFGEDVENAIVGLGNTQQNAEALASILLPDVLTFDTSNAGPFLNGRGLADDVIDAELELLSNGGVTTDGVDANDQQFLNVFPYLAARNTAAVPEPSTLLPIALGIGALVGRRRRRS